MELIQKIVWDWLWGTPLIIIVLAIGIYMTIRGGFFQFAKLGYVFKKVSEMLKGEESDKNSAGVISSLQATSVAIGTTVGVGNIGGVAAAIALGGPGAVFWMWIAGLLGAILKMCEITLAVHYRTKAPDGTAYGGPNYYMKKGIGKEKNWVALFKFLSFVFAFGYITTYIVSIQTYTVAEAVANTFNWDLLIVAIVYTVLLYYMISGGLRKIGKIASFLVPIMCLFYIGAGVFIIIDNIDKLPQSLALIISGAFNGTAAIGGFGGAAFAHAIRLGMARSVFSNEAGWGSAAMVHASAKVDHPVKQGLFGVFEVFIDTIIICSVTALVIIITGEWSSGLDGATLTLSAYEAGIGNAGRVILALAMLLFGITTSSGGYAQVEVIVRYLVGDRPIKNKILAFYKWTFPIPALIMVWIAVTYGMPGTTLWLFTDMSTALPIFANLIAIFILSPKFFELLKDYKARYLGIGKIKPDLKLFYDDNNTKEENV